MFSPNAHQVSDCETNRSAVPVKLDTLGECFNVVLLQTFCCTMNAYYCTCLTGIDAGLKFLMTHFAQNLKFLQKRFCPSFSFAFARFFTEQIF